MTFDKYQEMAKKTAIYPADNGLDYVTLGLCSEAGEVAGKVKKLHRDKTSQEDFRSATRKEIGGVLWYLAMLATEIGVSLDDAAIENLLILANRADRGVLGGSGDNR